MKLPEGCPFVILDFVHTDKPAARITNDFVDWVVRDCARVAEMMAPPGGRAWTAEQALCFKALMDAHDNILTRYELEPK